MRNFNIKRQINKLYTLTTVSYFRIAGASWVALLALRGFSLLQIGILESIFHIASSCFEIPSGVVADVFGRKRTLALSKLVSVLSCLAMILSDNFGTVAFAIAFSALSYNLESGTIEALAYDSLKSVKQEEKYNQYASTEMMLYRITSSTATLCAGFALWLGYKKAYAIDIFFGMIALGIVCSLREISGFTGADDKLINSQTDEYNKKQMSEHPHFSENSKRCHRELAFHKKQSQSQKHYDRKCIDRCSVNTCPVFPAGKAATGGIERGTAWPGSFCHGTRSRTRRKSSGIFSKMEIQKVYYFKWNRCVVCVCNDVFGQSISDGSWRICWFFCR